MSIGILFRKTMLHLIGWAFIPTPPSPVPDFGLQFLFSLVVGIIAPKALVDPFNRVVDYIGRKVRWFFSLFPGIRVLVEKTDSVLKKWEGFVKKERYSDRRFINKVYKILGKKDIIKRIIFGYFISILLGIIFIVISIFP